MGISEVSRRGAEAQRGVENSFFCYFFVAFPLRLRAFARDLGFVGCYSISVKRLRSAITCEGTSDELSRALYFTIERFN